MPVSITIDDGPPASPWLSPTLVPGRLTGNSFTPASGNTLRAGTTYDFKVTVRNTGSEATMAPVGVGPTGPFIAAAGLVAGGNSPTGTSSASVSNSAGFPELQLFNAGGQQVWSMSLASPQNTTIPVPRVFGYSPSGRIFVLVTEIPTGILNIYCVAAETVGTGANQQNAGSVIDLAQISSSQGATQWASAGLGFVPTLDVLYLTWSTVSGTEFQLINLGPNVTQRRNQIDPVSAAQAGQVLFSPSGDVMALIGQPMALNNDILLYKTPGLSRLPWMRLGMPVPQLQVQLPVSLQAIKPRGFEAIQIQSGSTTRLIDSPTPALPAVAVYLWVDTSSTVFSTVTAKQYPQGTPGSMQAPSAYIDRIAANASVNAVIDANWSATLPPPGQHFCAIAEAFTTPGTLPADPRQRVGTALSLLERQIAQRNLVVT